MPDLPLLTIVAAALAVTLAYTVFGLTGFGAAIVGVPLLAHVVPIRFAVPMMLVFDLCAGLLLGLRTAATSTAASCFASRPSSPSAWCSASPRSCARPSAGCSACSARSSSATRAGASPAAPRRGRSRRAGSLPAGMAGGVFTALYGSGGPIYTVYLARRLGDATRLRATIAVLIFCTAWARLALFSATGLMSSRRCSSWRSCSCRAPSPATSSAATCTGDLRRAMRRGRSGSCCWRAARRSLARASLPSDARDLRRSAAQRDHRPAAARGLGPQARVGIDHHRRADRAAAAAGR